MPKQHVPADDAGAEEAEEDGGENAKSGPNSVVDVTTLTDLTAWVHSRPPILVQGRVEQFPPPEDAAEEEGGAPVAPTSSLDLPLPHEIWEGIDDGKPLPLEAKPKKTLKEDRQLGETGIDAFSIRVKRDPFVRGEIDSVLVRSHIWPGALTVAYGGRRGQFASFYCGYGKKYTSQQYTMPPPPILPEECPEMDEEFDPTVADENALIKISPGQGMEETRGEEGEEAAEGEEEDS
jgi:radial spoke head protein 4A